MHMCVEIRCLLFTCGDVEGLLFFFFGQADASLSKLQGSLQTSYEDMDDKFKTLQKRLSNDHAKILHCLDNLGLICAYEVLLCC